MNFTDKNSVVFTKEMLVQLSGYKAEVTEVIAASLGFLPEELKGKIENKEIRICNISCFTEMNELHFRLIWKHLCSLYKSEHKHCLEHGCGKETLAKWANLHLNRKSTIIPNWTYISPKSYRDVLNEAVRRGWAKEYRNSVNYRCYEFMC